MFGHRLDGRKLKTISPFFTIISNVMMQRSDSQVFFKDDISLKALDDYIDKKAAEGIKITHMTIIYAAIIRLIAERPQLNRFCINGGIYARKGIHISLAIKKSLTDDGEETTIKLPFTGSETIFEVKEKLEKAIEENKTDMENGTDKLAKSISIMPSFLVKWSIKFLWFLDNHGLLPKSVIEVSPFHTSAFITNVGSLGIDSIYHHIYNFGTTSMFLAMGKKKKSYIYEDEDIHQEKCISIAFVGDERICDGYYYASSFKQLHKLLRKPELLEIPAEVKQDVK